MLNATTQLQDVINNIVMEAEEAISQVDGTKLEFPGMPAPAFYLSVRGDSDAAAEEFEEMERKHEAAVQVVGQQLELYLKQMMSASWGWNGGARDIINTGQLMASGKVTITSNGIDISYASPYAMFVHYGGYIHPYGNTNIEKVYLPGRPWISATLGQAGGPLPPFDWDNAYMQAMKGA